MQISHSDVQIHVLTTIVNFFNSPISHNHKLIISLQRSVTAHQTILACHLRYYWSVALFQQHSKIYAIY